MVAEVVEVSGNPAFTYEQMKLWYDQIKVRELQPALTSVNRYLTEMLDENLSDFDKSRIRLGPGRLKSSARLWAKINQHKYIEKINDLGDIPIHIDDLVGVRIICNNTSDIGAVKTMLSALPDLDEGGTPPIAMESAKERTYHLAPKESGYRAYHVNLSLHVGSGIKYDWRRVSVEVQVRTLLQDGWGELTHEDTYKPGAELPPLVKTLALRMANLLGCVDELAQDLRDELDRQSSPQLVATSEPVEADEFLSTALQAAVDEAPQPTGIAKDPVQPFPRDALIEETKSIVHGLQKPETLANIAYRLQTLFGNEISQQRWGPFGSFKALLLEAVPGCEIENVPPGWVIPPGLTRDDIPGIEFVNDEQQAAIEGVPEVVLSLRRFEKNMPVVASDVLSKYLNAAAAALDEGLWQELGVQRTGLGIQQVNLLSKTIRDRLLKAGSTLKRAKIGYLLVTLLNSGNLRPGIGLDDIRHLFSSHVKSRIRHHGIDLPPESSTEVDVWIGA